ncbi:MAG TPA: CheR family methyltransferase [Bryobacteraceae bacterium]|nr:CheR family methyltransferase [Bryobacteraceae bacterium]
MDTHKENLSTADFERLRSLIHAECGIHLSGEKKTMLEIRLRRRLQNLQLSSCAEYCNFVFAPGGKDQELVHLIDAVTTNKTDFFREPDHFEFLATRVLPDLDARNGADRRSLVWSAGCSTGEEPYTLAMVLSEYAQGHAGFRFSVLATDISTAVLAKARLGVFKAEAVKPVRENLRRKYVMRSRDPGADQVRIVPELRAKVEFRRMNFMDAGHALPAPPEIVFCRNVIIYFDRPTQLRVLERLTRQLAPGGYFFSGHSESLQNMGLPLVAVGPAIYRKTE